MAVTTHYNGDFIHSILDGVITDDVLMTQVREVERLEAELPITPDRLTDISATTKIAMDFNQMALLSRRRRSAVVRNAIRSAIVAATPVQFGMARMFQTMTGHPQITVQIFPDVPSALAWLRPAPSAE